MNHFQKCVLHLRRIKIPSDPMLITEMDQAAKSLVVGFVTLIPSPFMLVRIS